MTKGRKLGFSIFIAVLTVILIACIVCTVSVNYIFGSSNSSGRVFGKNIFIMNSSDMMPEIENGAAVIAKESEITVLTEGNVILFKQDKNTENVMRIVEVVHNTDSTVYRVAADSKQDEVMDVPKENVIAKCTTESMRLGKVISFLKSIVGILAGMILPCLILLVLLAVKILSVRKQNKEEEEEMFYVKSNEEDYDNEPQDASVNPLFDPSAGVKPDMSFQAKKSSIAENFAMKSGGRKGNSDLKNKQSENAVEKFRAAVDEKPSGPVTRRPSLAPEASGTDKRQKMAAIKAALNNQGNEQNNPAEDKPDLEKTAAFKIPGSDDKAAAEINTNQAAPVPDSAPLQSKPSPQPVQPMKKPAPKPKKQDNIHSIDDLIKALEEEKKKL